MGEKDGIKKKGLCAPSFVRKETGTEKIKKHETKENNASRVERKT